MARVLLIRPGPDRLAARRRFVPDVGIGFLAAALKRAGHEVDFVDLNRPGSSDDELIQLCKSRGHQIVGIKAFSNESPLVARLLGRIKASNPRIITVLGGPHASGMAGRVLDQFPGLDLAFAGEAEAGLARLASLVDERGGEALGSHNDLSKVPGLVFRAEDGVRAIQQRLVEDLDSLGLPDFEAMNLGYFTRHDACFFGRYLPLMTGRGCPMPCTYCAAHLINGRRRRAHSIGYLMSYLRVLRDEYGGRSFSLIDDHFLADPDFAERFCRALIEEDMGLLWQCASNGVRAEGLTEGLVRLMERSGCRFMSVGIESASPAVLASMRRNVDVNLLYGKIDMVHRVSRIKVCGFHVLGYPGETAQDRELTLRRTLKSSLDYGDFLIFQPFPGSEIGEKLTAEAGFGAWTNIDYDMPSATLDPGEADSVKRFQRRAYLRFFLRPRILVRAFLRGPSFMIMLKNLLSVFAPARSRPCLNNGNPT